MKEFIKSWILPSVLMSILYYAIDVRLGRIMLVYTVGMSILGIPFRKD